MAPREYCVWNSAEEKALLSGVQRHGLGAWEVIRSDPDFKTVLRERTGVQLKDKWRNLVKFKHISRVPTDFSQLQNLNLRDRKRRRVHSPDTLQRSTSRRDAIASHCYEDMGAERIHGGNTYSPSTTTTSIQHHRRQLDLAEQQYAGALAVMLVAQAACQAASGPWRSDIHRPMTAQPPAEEALANSAGQRHRRADGSDTPGGKCSADGQQDDPTPGSHQAAVSGHLAEAAGSRGLHASQTEKRGTDAAASTPLAPAEQAPDGNKAPSPAAASADASSLPGSAGQAGAEATAPAAGTREASIGSRIAAEDISRLARDSAQVQLSDVTAALILSNDAAATQAWLADSRRKLQLAEQAVVDASAGVQQALRATPVPVAPPLPVQKRSSQASPASRRLSQRNKGKLRRSYKDELDSDMDEQDADDDDTDGLEGALSHEDRRFGIYDSRRYKSPSRGSKPSTWQPLPKEGKAHNRRGHSPPGVATPDRPDGRALRPGSSGSVHHGRGGIPSAAALTKERLAPRDSMPMDIHHDLLHTLLELHGGRGELDDARLAWGGSNLRSPRYRRDYWPNCLLVNRLKPSHWAPAVQHAGWPLWREQSPSDLAAPELKASGRPAGSSSQTSRPRRHTSKSVRLRDMLAGGDDDAEDEANAVLVHERADEHEEDPDSDNESPFARRRWGRAASDHGRRQPVPQLQQPQPQPHISRYRWGRTRPRHQMADGILTDEDSMAEMTFDKDIRDGALALTLAHEAYQPGADADLDDVSPSLADHRPGLHMPRPSHASHIPNESLLQGILDEGNHGLRMQSLGRPQAHYGYGSQSGDLILHSRQHQGSAELMPHDHALVDRPPSRGGDMGFLGMLGIMQMRGGAAPRASTSAAAPLDPIEQGHIRVPTPSKAGVLLHDGRLQYSDAPLDVDVDLDLAAEHHHQHLDFDPLRVDALHANHRSERLDSPRSASSNMSSDVAASDSHYISPPNMPHPHPWVHHWTLQGPQRELPPSRELSCSTPPLLLPGTSKAAASGSMAREPSLGAELDEAAAAITSMMHQRQAMGEGYGGGFAQSGDALASEQLTDARGPPDLGRQHAGATPSELMDSGPDPQLHFDLDQMLDVHQEAAGLGQSASMDGRMLHRSQSEDHDIGTLQGSHRQMRPQQ